MPRAGPPPLVPRVLDDDDQPLRHVHFRLWQISIIAVTVLLTCWSYTLHLSLGITATFLGKHILVAVLAAGLNVPPLRDKD